MKYVIVILMVVLAACGAADVPQSGGIPAVAEITATPLASADSSFAVTLSRTACHGTCPVYTVTIDVDRVVVFNGEQFVEQTGIHTSTLTPEEFTQLIALVDAADAVGLKNDYSSLASDLPGTDVSFTRNGKTQTIHHYGTGCFGEPGREPREGDAPIELCRLEDGIDAIANTQQWIMPDMANPTPEAHGTPDSNVDDSFTVALERTVCFGFCPAYTVTIDMDRVVVFNGEQFVEQTGIHTSTLTPEEFTQLIALVDAADAVGLKDEYISQATDLPSANIAFTRNGKTQTIHHYGSGCVGDGNNIPELSGGAPMELCNLELGIDTITNTKQWIGNPQR